MASDGVWRIGVDEAGYGPNLGPLVVAATAWRSPPDADLDTALAPIVDRSGRAQADRLLIADSKAVYQPGGGLAALERAVHATGGAAASWSELVERLGADPDRHADEAPWREGYDPALPIDADPAALSSLRDDFTDVCAASGVTPPRLAARLVYPTEFNQLVDEHGSKGAALSFISIGLAKRLYDEVATAEPVEFVFDKHGGRNRYGALLQEHFPDGWVETLAEARPESRYRLGERLAFRFRSGGEEELPVALASMTAKLLRELAMNALNAFWTERVPGLKPTAGYPVDAKRFKAAIAAKQQELRIDDLVLWRNR